MVLGLVKYDRNQHVEGNKTMGDSLYRLNQSVVTELDALNTQPVLLYALDGHVDSGMVAGLVISDLIDGGGLKRVATFDTDQLFNYRTRRPPMVCGPDGWAICGRVELVIDLVRDQANVPVLVMYGPEPDLKWEGFAQSVLEIVELLDARLALGFYGQSRMVPHTRPPSVHGPAETEEAEAQAVDLYTRLHAPGSAMAMIEFVLRRVARPAHTLTADVPSYLSNVPYSKAALAMILAINQTGGLQLDTSRLAEASEHSAKRLDAEVAKTGDLSRTVKELEQRFDKLHGPVVTQPKMVVNQLVKEIQAYLADQS